jgi:hypothetical protein
MTLMRRARSSAVNVMIPMIAWRALDLAIAGPAGEVLRDYFQ